MMCVSFFGSLAAIVAFREPPKKLFRIPGYGGPDTGVHIINRGVAMCIIIS